jgi:hypothetical protein
MRFTRYWRLKRIQAGQSVGDCKSWELANELLSSPVIRLLQIVPLRQNAPLISYDDLRSGLVK